MPIMSDFVTHFLPVSCDMSVNSALIFYLSAVGS
jgi:hypothetical protein